jgi:hypothetical protein
MDLTKIQEIIRRKPPLFLLVSLGFLIGTAFIKWGIHPSWATLFYGIGGILGVYFLDVGEVFFNLTPSPFRSIVFAILFAIVGLFIVTSSGSMMASGLVLSLFLTLILWQLGEWQIKKNLNDWYSMVAMVVNTQIQLWIFFGFIVLFIVESYLFIHW